MLNHAGKIFALREQWADVRDARVKPRFSPALFPLLWLVMFNSRLASFNALEQLRGSKSLARHLGCEKLPCADEMAIVSEGMDVNHSRDVLGHVMKRLRRNKALVPRHGLMLAAVDGHEMNSSYKRCCASSLERKKIVNGQEVIQYYYRFTVFQIIGEGFHFILDLEPVLPGEDEVASALRLIARVLEKYPRCFDVLTADAIYLRPAVIAMLLAAGKHVITTLKENQPDLLSEARLLLPGQPPVGFSLPKSPGKSPRTVELREADGFTTDSISTPLRVVHARENFIRQERVAGKPKDTPVESNWYWATTMPSSLLPARVIFEFGHDRWRIENEGFNELVNRWHSRHVFHHHPNSMLVLWLTLFLAHAVFHCFLRNLKPALRLAHTDVHFAACITAELLAQQRWRPPSPG